MDGCIGKEEGRRRRGGREPLWRPQHPLVPTAKGRWEERGRFVCSGGTARGRASEQQWRQPAAQRKGRDEDGSGTAAADERRCAKREREEWREGSEEGMGRLRVAGEKALGRWSLRVGPGPSAQSPFCPPSDPSTRPHSPALSTPLLSRHATGTAHDPLVVTQRGRVPRLPASSVAASRAAVLSSGVRSRRRLSGAVGSIPPAVPKAARLSLSSNGLLTAALGTRP